MYAHVLPEKTFSKQTSNAASACEVKTVLCSPATSLGLPYSLPAVSLICHADHPSLAKAIPP